MPKSLRHTFLLISALFLLGHSLWPHAHRLFQGEVIAPTEHQHAGDLATSLTHAFSIYQGEGHLTSFSTSEAGLDTMSWLAVFSLPLLVGLLLALWPPSTANPPATFFLIQSGPPPFLLSSVPVRAP